MKITILTPQYFPTVGGVPVLAELFAKAFQRLGHSVVVVSAEDSSAARRDDSFPVFRKPGPRLLVKILHESDLLVSLQECLSLTWPMAAKLVRRPLVVFLQMHPPGGSGLRSLPKKLARKALFSSATVCACSEYIASDVRKAEKVAVHAVHNPYNDEIFHPAREGDRDIDILYVGRLAVHKRCDVLLEAIAINERFGFYPRVVVAGDGPEESKLQSLARDRGLRNCNFFGPVSQKEAADLMRRAKTLVVSSGYEPFGIVVLEGLASGCEVITSDAGGLTEAGGGFTRTFPYNDLQSLAKVLRSCSGATTSYAPVEAGNRLDLFLEQHRVSVVAARLLCLSKALKEDFQQA